MYSVLLTSLYTLRPVAVRSALDLERSTAAPRARASCWRFVIVFVIVLVRVVVLVVLLYRSVGPCTLFK